MARLTLDAAGRTIADIDLGETVESGTGLGYFDAGELSATGGNLYLNIDGEEYGSLFFFREPDGTVSITLGSFDPERQDWVESATLHGPIDFGSEG